MIKKGYLFVTFFALFLAFSRTLKYQFFARGNLNEPTCTSIIFQLVILFIVFLIPGLMIARWYYKNKIK